MKKIFLTLLITIVVFPNTAFAKFTDVNEDHPYGKSIQNLEQEGVVKGYKDNTFKPDSSINRAEFVKIIIGAINESAEGTNCFVDVKKDWYAPYICKAKTLGLVSGNPDGKFLPSQDINLAEASKIIANALKLPLDETSDAEEWFTKYIKALEAKGALPMSLNSFQHKITRGEMAEMIVRAKSETNNEASFTYESLKVLTFVASKGGMSESDLAKFKSIDFKTFTEVITKGNEQVVYYFKDKNHVYASTDFEIVKEFDSDTFEINSFEYGFPTDGTYFLYGKTKDNFWYYNNKENKNIIDENIDANSFEIIAKQEFRIYEEAGYDTQNFIYSDKAVCKSIEKEYSKGTFSSKETGDFQKNEDGSCIVIAKYPREAGYNYLEGFFAKDKNNVYKFILRNSILEKIENVKIDVASFEAIPDKGLFKDKNGVYRVKDLDLEEIKNTDL